MHAWQRWDYDMERLPFATILACEEADSGEQMFSQEALLQHDLAEGH